MSNDDFFKKVGTKHVPLPRPPTPDTTATLQAMEGNPAQQAGAEIGVSRWANHGDVFYGVGETIPELAPGLYRTGMAPNLGPVLIRQKVDTDNLLELPDTAAAALIAEFEQFWQIGDKFRARGFLHKRGFILHGPPGGGKTSTLMLMAKRLVAEQKGIVLTLDHPQVAAQCFQLLRKIEPKRPVVALMEDIDALVQKFGENEYLALLDGEAQVDSIVNVATTNYPENLDPRFVDRPSRFDTIGYVGMPTAAARRVYLVAKEPSLEGTELDAWVDASDGFSIAHLKEMIVAIRCFEQPFEAVVERLQQMRERRPNSAHDPDRRGFGFQLGKSNGLHGAQLDA